MKTNDLIKDLTQKLDPARDLHFYRNSVALLLSGTAGLFALFFFVIPVRPDIAERMASPLFNTEVFVSFALFLAAAYISYRSSVPGLMGRWEVWTGGFLLTAMVVFVFSKFSLEGLPAELDGEMDFYRGRCGPIMLVLAGLESALGLAVARHTAPTRPIFTGAWIAISAGALGLSAMQLICDHENFLHLFIWHGLPFVLLVGAGMAAGKKILNW